MAAKKEIEINGHVFNKCHISKQQWKDCITPCTFCHTTVQSACDHNNPFCGDEKVCYVDLGAIYGEEVNEDKNG